MPGYRFQSPQDKCFHPQNINHLTCVIARSSGGSDVGCNQGCPQLTA